MIETNKQLCAAALSVANERATVYVLGAFGWPMTEANKNRAFRSYEFNRSKERQLRILAANDGVFGFDCICFVKALLWGWNAIVSDQYGGAVYQSNGVPDIDEKEMLNRCLDVSDDFSNVMPGEFLWTEGHCGIYVGNGKAAEATHRWADGVQLTDVYNITGVTDGFGRVWQKHGKLPYISYEAESSAVTEENKKGDYTLGMRFLRHGCIGEDVKNLQRLLMARGYDLGSFGADGDFGDKTESAVMAYQLDCEISVDGVVGYDTMSRLLGVVT